MGLVSRALLLLDPRRQVREAFRRHYERRDWLETETVSGRGSTLRSTETIRRELPLLFARLGVRSVLDAGCGDFHWFAALQADLDSYVGVEVVEQLAEENRRLHGDERHRFLTRDVIRDALPRADLILCRDCLVHLKNRQVSAALRNFRRSGSRYLLATTFPGCDANREIPLGGWRPIDLARPPFRLGPPIDVVGEGASVEDPAHRDKALGLWRLDAGDPRD
jgi:SAM-dependent methyltransferase